MMLRCGSDKAGTALLLGLPVIAGDFSNTESGARATLK